MIPPDVIQKWQTVWKQLLDMVYYRKDVKPELFIQTDSCHDLYVWCRTEPDFDKLTFNYAWEKYNYIRDRNNKLIEPSAVPELKRMLIPNVLFHCTGIHTFIKTCLPNCEIAYWEDDSPV